jgi:SecD/SecF fusion protein
MRNKGFFWFFTILAMAICIYQLSFTLVSNKEEKKAEKEADARVEELWDEIEKAGDTIGYLPNNTPVNINKSGDEEKAKAAFINQILKEKAETPVYPVFGSTFKDVKKRSLSFGLDLVGGMSVTIEVSTPDLIKNYAQNSRTLTFKKPYEAALNEYGTEGGDFVEIFYRKHKEFNKDMKLYKLFAISDIDEIGTGSTDEDVLDFLTSKEGTSMDGVEKIMTKRINQFGVAQPNIQKDPTNNRLYIELPGVQDEETVADKIQSTANLQFFETKAISEIGPQWQAAVQLSRTAAAEEKEEDTSKVETPEPEVQVNENGETLAVNNEEPEEVESLTESLTAGSELGGQKGLGDLVKPYTPFSVGYCASENKSAVDQLLNRKDIKGMFETIGVAFMWSADLEVVNTDTKEMGFVLYAISVPESGRAKVGGKDIKSASRGYDQQEGKITVDLEMTEEGGDKWAQMTADNEGRVVAITMDNVVYSAPRVNEAITGGRTQISGSFSIEEAQDLSDLLNGGALPVPCVIKEMTKVGPTIGAENARSGLLSFAAALVLVFIYMIFYYGKAGIIADIALFANILFIFGVLAAFHAVLTLAGIAGIVLTIGMAVDANVLIFERVREEQAGGKDLKSAIDTGFKKALSSIIDANVTTLLTAIVLKNFGSGPIESFATTLIYGIFTSVFAALVITRLCMNWWMNKGKGINFESKMTKGAFKNFNINFVGKRKTYYMVSGVLIAASIAALVGRNLNRNSHTLEITTNYLLAKEDAGEAVKTTLESVLAKHSKDLGKANILEWRAVSASVSKELISSSMIAIILSLIIIFTYILMRFGRWQYSTGAIIAMTHDVTIVLGIFAALHGILPFNMDIDQAFIAAILTVIGYSINDTVIVFDRIRENLRLHKSSDEKDQINRSLNSTLSRTINTSMTTFIVLLVIFIFGGAAIKGFIFALMIGVLVGTYSSVCIATPVLIDFSKRVGTGKTEDAE